MQGASASLNSVPSVISCFTLDGALPSQQPLYFIHTLEISLPIHWLGWKVTLLPSGWLIVRTPWIFSTNDNWQRWWHVVTLVNTLHTGFFFHFTVYSWPVLSGFLLQGHLPKWSRQEPNPRPWPTLHRLRSQAHPWQRCRKPKPYFPFLCEVKLWCKNCAYLSGLLGELQETVNIKGLGQCLALGEFPVKVTSYNCSPEQPQTREYAWSLGRMTPASSHWALPLLSPYSRLQQFLNHQGSSFLFFLH